MRNIIVVNEKTTKLRGYNEDILFAFTNLIEHLVNENITTKEGLHDLIDITFMSNEELKELAKKRMLELFDNIKEKLGEKDE